LFQDPPRNTRETPKLPRSLRTDCAAIIGSG
jgi:hypothetical protein